MAQKQLYDQYADLLLGICIRYSTDRAEAQDILQEGFLKILLNIKLYSGEGSFLNWMRKVMVNTAITLYHKNKKHRYHYDIDEVREVPPGKGSPREDPDYTRDELFALLNSLPEGYRMVFNLYAVEGYKHKEIADLLDIDINTSKSQYSRARKYLRARLEVIKKQEERYKSE